MSQNLLSAHFAALMIGALKANSFLASGNFYCLLITLSKILDPDQDLYVDPDLDPNHLTF